jgi:5-methylcytosine-specific restriction endonuclease McrA
MKEWAKEFYHSKSWKDTRLAYLKAQHYLCERCGEPAKVVHHKHYLTKRNINNTDITLNWDNLEALCQDCHNKEHHAAADTRRYRFDADGNVIATTP